MPESQNPAPLSKKSHSSLSGITLFQKLRENLALLAMRVGGPKGEEIFDGLFDEIAEYDAELFRHTNTHLRDAAVLEIGYGARPNRLLAVTSLGIDARGIDLDRPLLELSASRLLSIYKQNGLERAVKSLVRGLLFDRSERTALARALKRRGASLRVDAGRFVVGDAATAPFGPDSFDFVYSEDVFEHIPVSALEELLKKMHSWLRPSGIAFIRPNVYTGITGGHQTEWYPHQVDREFERQSEPWEHLRKKRYRANCFLNELARSDYRRLFRRYFDIVEERVWRERIGAQYLTDDVRRELAAYPEEELFSNRVLFVLRKKQADTLAAREHADDTQRFPTQ